MPGTDLITSPQGGGAVVSAEQQAQWAADAGQGTENIGAQDIAIPFIGHVQSQSQQLDEASPKYLADAKVGSLFNTVTGECFDPKEGIVVVPAEIRKIVAEKEPTDRGGKIVKIYDTRAEAQQNAETGNDLLDGFRVLVLYKSKSGGWTPAVVSFATKSKVYTMKQWNALLTGVRVDGPNGTKIQPPIFAYAYRITSAQQKFDQGTAAVLKVVSEGPSTDEVYQQAKSFRKALAAGTVKIAAEESEGAATEEKDDLPF